MRFLGKLGPLFRESRHRDLLAAFGNQRWGKQFLRRVSIFLRNGSSVD